MSITTEFVPRRRHLLGWLAGGAAALSTAHSLAGPLRARLAGGWRTDALVAFGPATGSGANGAPVFGADGRLYLTSASGGQHGLGTLSCWSPADGQLVVLHDFDYSTQDGFSPGSGLLAGSDGRLWGTTAGGGANLIGTLYAYTPGGGLTLMAAFGAPGSDAGYSPEGGLIEVRPGQFYGTTFESVYRFSAASGRLRSVYRFRQAEDGFGAQAALAQGPGGWLYGTNPLFGPRGHGTVYRVAADGSAFEVLHAFAGGSRGAEPSGELLRLRGGGFCGIARGGGGYGKGLVFRLDDDGGNFQVLHHFGGGVDDGAYPAAGLIEGPDGALYGSTLEGGAAPQSYGTAFRLGRNGRFQLLHRFSDADAAGGNPVGTLTFGPDGLLYGCTESYAAQADGALFRLSPPA